MYILPLDPPLTQYQISDEVLENFLFINCFNKKILDFTSK